MRKITSLALVLALLLNIVLFASPAKAEGIEDLDIIWVDYDECEDFYNGMALVMKKYDEDVYKYGYIDKTGKLFIPVEFDHIGEFENGLAKARKGDITGYIDKTGKFVKQYKYAFLGDFIDGVAVVKSSHDTFGSYGVIDESGKVIIPTNKDVISDLSNGLIRIWDNEETIYVDKTGKEVLRIKEYTGLDFHEGLVRIISKENKEGFMDKTGAIVIPTIYDYVGDFKDGLVFVIKDDKCGYIDKTGKEVIPLIYDHVGEFEDGLAKVKNNFKYGYIDKTGTIVVPIKYDFISDFKEGLAYFQVKGNSSREYKYGYVDKTGNEVIPPIYRHAYNFSEGLAAVEVEIEGKYDENGYSLRKTGFIDKTGKLVIPAEYDYAGEFKEGVAIVAKDDKYGYIDKTGREIVPLIFNEAYPSSDGMMRVRDENGRYGYIKNPFKNEVQAIPTQSKITVDGKEIKLEAYTIKGNNYFKLRDLAMALNGTSKQFEVSWDSEATTITILKNKPYTPVGGELTLPATSSVKEAVSSSSIVKINGENTNLTAYAVEGSNYFKFRDIAKALNFGVTWKANTNSVIIDTTAEYSE